MHLKSWLELFVGDFIVKHYALFISFMHFSIEYSNSSKTAVNADQYV